MRANAMQDEIRELNLAYLMLAQQMLREDRAAAIYRLGIGEEVADVLGALSSAQVLPPMGTMPDTPWGRR